MEHVASRHSGASLCRGMSWPSRCQSCRYTSAFISSAGSRSASRCIAGADMLRQHYPCLLRVTVELRRTHDRTWTHGARRACFADRRAGAIPVSWAISDKLGKSAQTEAISKPVDAAIDWALFMAKTSRRTMVEMVAELDSPAASMSRVRRASTSSGRSAGRALRWGRQQSRPSARCRRER